MDIDLLIRSNLAIEDGIVVKNRMGSSGRKAEAEDFDVADVILTRGVVVRNESKFAHTEN